MSLVWTLVFGFWLVGKCSLQDFPPNFKFGAASAAYQIEGAWNVDGKGESIWDRLLHNHPETISDRSNGDVASNTYNLWREDIKLAAELRLDYYRFSISWPRIMPTGLPNNISEAGLKHYDDFIDELLFYSIEPVVTIYHWDLPVKLQDLGGWTNPLIVDWFESYADILFRNYGNRVKTWITINEPIVICDFNYNSGAFAPDIQEQELAPYICNKNVLMAHAKAYRLYQREYREKYNGKLSLANNVLWIDSKESPRDDELRDLGREHMIGRYSHPIFSREGGWPPSIEKLMLRVSLKQGYNESRLPSFTEQEKAFVKGTADFYGMNYYSSRLIRQALPGERGYWFSNGSPELDAMLELPPGAKHTSIDMLPMFPEGLGKMLLYLKNTYGNVDFLITENGYPGWQSINDIERVQSIRAHLEHVLLAIKHNVSVIGYTYWSLLDSFEWISGYESTFGLYSVDFADPKRRRKPRLSAKYYACIINSHSLNISHECTKNMDLIGYNANRGHRNSFIDYLLIVSLVRLLNH
ncbi:myrosinase 1-like [Pieris napi]|uniref:myrosinase 1-like n=1 Tax=Pieris napi TaxID=78633 RepID=UPI001FB9DBFB|nr:myrosinase 1-like [Pieris napi]